MAETPISLSVLHALGDVVFALLAATVLAVPIAVPVGYWWVKR